MSKHCTSSCAYAPQLLPLVWLTRWPVLGRHTHCSKVVFFLLGESGLHTLCFEASMGGFDFHWELAGLPFQLKCISRWAFDDKGSVFSLFFSPSVSLQHQTRFQHLAKQKTMHGPLGLSLSLVVFFLFATVQSIGQFQRTSAHLTPGSLMDFIFFSSLMACLLLSCNWLEQLRKCVCVGAWLVEMTYGFVGEI